MNILLINPGCNTTLSPGSFPLGLGYIAAVLVKEGHRVEVFDARALQYSPREVAAFLRRNLRRFDLVGITGMITVYATIKRLAAIIKETMPQMPVMAGGSAASSAPDLMLGRTAVDILCIGEGEETVVEVVRALEENRPLEGIKGIHYKKGGRIFKNPPRPLIRDLDTIPYPAWELFPMELYLKRNLIIPTSKNSMNAVFSRGCPYSCTFCYRNMGKTVRVRSAANMIGELKILRERYGVSHLEFQDELFIVSRDKCMELCGRIIEEKLDLEWRCLGRVNLVDDELLGLMRRSGCRWIGFGVESGSQRMLDRMNKSVRVEQIKEAIGNARRAGMEVSGTFIMGLPGETEETIRETVEFCKEMSLYNDFFFPVPYPGTELYDEAVLGGSIREEEEFIARLDGNMTEIIVNFTRIDDRRLLLLKQESEAEIKSHIAAAAAGPGHTPGSRNDGHNFTAHNSAEINRMVTEHLALIAARLAAATDTIRSMVLVGGFGRGEGSVIVRDGAIVPLNDYDIVLFTDGDPGDLRSLAETLATLIGIRHLDLIPIPCRDLSSLPASQFNFDMKYGGYTFWGEELLPRIPCYPGSGITRESSRGLLVNRLICLLESYRHDFREHGPDEAENFFLCQQTSKAAMALGEALLMESGGYHFSARERKRLLAETFPQEQRLTDLHDWSVDFKLFPSLHGAEDAVGRWRETVAEYLNILPRFLPAGGVVPTSPGTEKPTAQLYGYLSGPANGTPKEALEKSEMAVLAAEAVEEPMKTLFTKIASRHLAMAGAPVPFPADWETMRRQVVAGWFGMFH